jgi:hypothetical protein
VSNRSVQVVLRFRPPAVPLSEREGVPGWVTDGREIAVFAKDGRAYRLVRNGAAVNEPSELTEHQKAERQMMEIEEAIKSSQTPPAAKDELKEQLAKMKEEFVRRNRGVAEEAANPVNRSPRIARVRTERFPEGMARDILSKAGLSVGDVVSKEALERVRNIASETDEHIKVEAGHDENGDVVLIFITR